MPISSAPLDRALTGSDDSRRSACCHGELHGETPTAQVHIICSCTSFLERDRDQAEERFATTHPLASNIPPHHVDNQAIRVAYTNHSSFIR